MLIIDEQTALKAVGMADAIDAVEQAFIALEQGQAELFPVVTGHGGAPDRFFAVKSGVVGDRNLAGLKLGTYWPANRVAGLPSHGSTVLLMDTATGFPAALVSATGLTAIRTAAADAVAVRHLARPDAAVLGIVGAGHQAWYDLLAIRHVRPIKRVLVWNRDPVRADAFAQRARGLGLDAAATSLEETARGADILVTATAAREALVRAQWVRPGTHISAMGADAPGKQELDTALVASSLLVADSIAQSLSIGECQSAARAGLIGPGDVTTLGAVILGKGRPVPPDTVTMFDSSGTAIQDLAVAGLAVSRSLDQGLGTRVPLGA
ncbi:ornithine cyclodeaminase family protein [Niveispirillum sp. KHB5.9]|uniref:ornithine cyclodeaminase family protein n=1 Tax=Niveispirillum sp. KHB5.9 TaxID=3400269 RepID=UPI003A83DE92